MKLSIGNDHAGPDYKKAIVNHIESKGYSITNYGTDTEDSVDYPDFVHPVAKDVNNKEVDFVFLSGLCCAVCCIITYHILKFSYSISKTTLMMKANK